VLVERMVKVCADPLVELFVAETAGEANRTLVVVHGGPDWDHTYLLDPLVHLGNDRRVVFVDLRGCGRSTRGLDYETYTPQRATEDLVAVIDGLGPDPVDVLGFSYGGLLAQRLLVSAPTVIRRAVIASSSVLPVEPDAFVGWTERDERLASMPSEASGASDQDATWDAARTRRDAVSSAAANVWRRAALPGYLARLEQVQFSAEWSHSWLDGTLPPARPDDVVARLAELGTPILLLHGRQDMTFPVSLVEPTTVLIPSASGVVIEDAGHMAHVDQPERWLAAIRTFLDQPDH
jgi:pimeloyl-ACP methyl ester carboxylesterase